MPTLECPCCPDPDGYCEGVTLANAIYLTFSGFGDECFIQRYDPDFAAMGNGSYQLLLAGTPPPWVNGLVPSAVAWYTLAGSGVLANIAAGFGGGPWGKYVGSVNYTSVVSLCATRSDFWLMLYAIVTCPGEERCGPFDHYWAVSGYVIERITSSSPAPCDPGPIFVVHSPVANCCFEPSGTGAPLAWTFCDTMPPGQTCDCSGGPAPCNGTIQLTG